MNLRVTPNYNTQNNRQNPNFGFYFKCNKETLAALKKIAVGITDIAEIPNARTLYPDLKLSKNLNLYGTPADMVDIEKAADKDVFVSKTRNVSMWDVKRVRQNALDDQEVASAEAAEPDAKSFRTAMLERLGVNTGIDPEALTRLKDVD